MVLESTMICVDSSDYMRNGDFLPTRLQAQQDAVNLICHSKTRSNPENNVGLLTMSRVEVLVTLTSDVGHVLSRLHQVAPAGEIHFMSGIRVAHLALKHRQGKNHKMRIVVFVGSPIIEDEKELVKLAKRLKKEKVNVDVINFGEEGCNTDKLTGFVNTINGKEGTSSHLVTVPPGPILSDALVSSPIVVGEDGAGVVAGMGGSGFEFGVDPNEDPELALALRVSMEEQRARQEDEARKAAASSTAEMGTAAPSEDNTEETLLQQAIQMSQQPDEPTPAPTMPDFSSMTEEQQIAYALHMSMQADEKDEGESPMDVEESATEGAEAQDTKEEEEEDLAEVMNDPAFLQSVLEGLPGVDPRSAAIQQVVGSLTQKDDQSKNDDKKDDKKGDK